MLQAAEAEAGLANERIVKSGALGALEETTSVGLRRVGDVIEAGILTSFSCCAQSFTTYMYMYVGVVKRSLES